MVTLMSEEFVASKDDLLDTRKVQLKNHLMSCLPQILHQLNSIPPDEGERFCGLLLL